MKFKVGNRVRVINGPFLSIINNIEGTVIYIDQDLITIEFDRNVNGHNGAIKDTSIRGKYGHCWHINARDLELISKPAQKPKKKNNSPMLSKNIPNPYGYKRTEDGFLTSEKNWKKWLI